MSNFPLGYLRDLFDVFFPRACSGCNARLSPSEETLCISCELNMPRSNNWNAQTSDLTRKLSGKIPIEGAASYFRFEQNSPVQHLIHQLKYKGDKSIGNYIGVKLGELLIQPESVIKNIDVVVPLPLHPKKYKLRGFNQCEPFAESLSKILNAHYAPNALTRIVRNESQTKMTKYTRFKNVNRIFEASDESALHGKHILLVDDVVTTGATAESCLAAILDVDDTKVSFAAMAEVRSK